MIPSTKFDPDDSIQTGNKQTPQVNIGKILDPESNVQIKTVPKEIALQVQQARSKANKTQEELAKRIGVSRQTVNALEAGKYVPSTVLALKISKYFKMNVEEIFQLEDND